MKEIAIKDIRFYTNRSLKSCSEMNADTIPFYDLTFLMEGKMVYKINGEYIISKISLPLTYNGQMTIQATKAPQRFN